MKGRAHPLNTLTSCDGHRGQWKCEKCAKMLTFDFSSQQVLRDASKHIRSGKKKAAEGKT